MNNAANITTQAKPFLKWAGGKGQLIPAIHQALPRGFHQRKGITYIEPFVGSGALLFWILQQYPNIEHAIINDLNPDLTDAYETVRNEPHDLIAALKNLQSDYYAKGTEDLKRDFFLARRIEFNTKKADRVQHTALLIFLNKTCFNGLYRVNSKNNFNVPFGRYAKPRICDQETILADSVLLQKVTILNGDFAATLQHAATNAFFYFDPPYKPISSTSSFNAYAANSFGDIEQKRLRQFCDVLTAKKHQWLLSNSDPKNTNPADHFFDDLYAHPDITIQRVKAKRSINSNAAKRGEINELLISNYKP